MRVIRIALHRIRSLLRTSRAERELQQELAVHIEQLTREYQARGMSAFDARRAARFEFGPLEPVEERCRDMRSSAG